MYFNTMNDSCCKLAERQELISIAPFKPARSLGSSEAVDERKPSFIPRLAGVISHSAVTGRGEYGLATNPGKIPGAGQQFTAFESTGTMPGLLLNVPILSTPEATEVIEGNWLPRNS
jgi:hypothetical protein